MIYVVDSQSPTVGHSAVKVSLVITGLFGAILSIA